MVRYGDVQRFDALDTKAAFLIAFRLFQEPENSNPKHPAPAAMGGKRSKRKSGALRACSPTRSLYLGLKFIYPFLSY